MEPSERNEGQVPTCAEGSGARPELGECVVQLNALMDAFLAFRRQDSQLDRLISESHRSGSRDRMKKDLRKQWLHWTSYQQLALLSFA